MEFRILGPLDVLGGEGVLVVPGAKCRALLGLLLVQANRVVGTDRLIEDLWEGAPPESARAGVQTYVHQLRKALGFAGLRTRSSGYVLEVEPGQLDALRFERVVREVSSVKDAFPGWVAERLGEALAWWRGPALEDFRDLAWARPEVARLEELRLQAVEDRNEARLALGDHAALVPELEALVEHAPLRERLWGQLMMALYRCDRQAEALRAYGRLRRHLGEELGIEPSAELARLEDAVLLHKPELDWTQPQPQTARSPRSNLPVELSGFVGRAHALASVGQALQASRVVSIVGVGGVGKTRLALRVGREYVAKFADGVWLCELAAVRDAQSVADAVAAAVGYVPGQGLTAAEGLARFLRHQHLLIILDSCEHLGEDLARFALSMVEASPGISVLITSREPIGLPGERVEPLGSLDLPAEGDVASVLASEAGELFTLRAAEARGGFTVTEENAAAVRELCLGLDGIPLAIELAAARTAMMSPQEILNRLADRLRFLIAGSRTGLDRHRTLRAAIDSSYELFDRREQRLLKRCSVFVGGFDLEAATALAVHGGFSEGQAIEVLGSLVAKSLVERREAKGVTRYRLLEMIRDYAAEHLAASGDGDAARNAHARHYLAVDRRLFEQLGTSGDADALEQLEIETPNLAAAGKWLLDSSQINELLAFFPSGWLDFGVLPFTTLDELGRLAEAAFQQGDLDLRRDHPAACYSAAMRALYTGHSEQISSFVEPAAVEENTSVQLAVARTGELVMQGDMTAAAEILRTAVEHARQQPDPITLSYALANLATLEAYLPHPEARAHSVEAVAIARSTGSRSALLFPLVALSNATRDDPECVLAAAMECDRIDPSQRRLWSTTCQGVAALTHLQQGEIAEGLRLARRTIEHLHWTGDHFNLSIAIAGTANNLARTTPAAAVDLAAIAESQEISPFAVFDSPGFDNLGPAVQQVGPEALEAARARAASITYSDSVEFTLGTLDRLLEETESQEASRETPSESAV